MTNKRKKTIRELADSLGINRRSAASQLDSDRSKSSGRGASMKAAGAYAGPRGDAAPPVSLRELYACSAAGVLTSDGDSGGWTLVEPPPKSAPAELVERCRTARYVEAMEKNNWAVEARYALAQIGRDIATAYAESVRKGEPVLSASTAPTPPTVPAPGMPVLAIDQFRSDPGWRGIMFSMSHPIYFQYRIEAADRAFTASARGSRREKDGSMADVTLILRGRLDDSGALWTSALEETWATSTPRPGAADAGGRRVNSPPSTQRAGS
jgi:hypothetical protein